MTMTVAQLIKLLSKLPQDLPVKVRSDEYYGKLNYETPVVEVGKIRVVPMSQSISKEYRFDDEHGIETVLIDHA